jgi:hypothetical protein
VLNLNSETFRDKIYGCWLGKNCGGTLGAPLEKAFGEPDPFDIWWYPELKEGGIPNDDLEMQLIWLKALEEVGPGLRASHLSQYWLDHIGYNWDEYGLSKTNLRLGLLPPVSGHYNNWFLDCMGCPIRSEIWACIAPGLPAIAVKYAYEDAICDHAGGESVYGELFNTAIESAAFIISDREQLLDIGMSYVPASSQTARAINAARAAYADGVDWRAARKRVLEATPHYNAQYSPINMGFQVIGWLYGEDFGDAICKAVNCGYDTDCTGATLGSILGIIAGRSGLPQKWTQPLGEDISTNESWGGLRATSTGSNPVATTLSELTERVCTQAKRVLIAHGALSDDMVVRVDPASLYANEQTKTLWTASTTRIDYQYDALNVGVDYLDTPAVVPGEKKSLQIHLTNPHPEALQTSYTLLAPSGWQATEASNITIPPTSSVAVTVDVTVPQPAQVNNSNQLLLALTTKERTALPATPIVLIGAQHYLRSELYPADGLSDEELLNQELEPERVTSTGPVLTRDGRPGNWTEVYAQDNELPLQDAFHTSGALYVRTYFWNPDAALNVWLGAASNCPVKIWVNSQPVTQSLEYPRLRPNYAGHGSQGHYATVHLQEGWNEVLLKFVRSENAPAFAAHFVASSADTLHNGLPSLGRTRTPWDL